jgi:putative transposase
VRSLGIAQIRTPFRSPQANAIAERWVRSLREEFLDHVFIFNERQLRAVLAEYAIFQPLAPGPRDRSARSMRSRYADPRSATREIIGEPVLGGLHHVYHLAA